MARRRNRSGDSSSHARSTSSAASPVARVSWLWRAAVVLAVVAAVAVIMARKQERDATTDSANIPAIALAASHTLPGAPGIPRLVDVGADRCIPCKAMAPILEELRTEYAGRMQVKFIDVWKDPDAGDPYHVYAIPTQIFYDRDGRELERHQGFISKADILTTWARHGYDFSVTGTPASEN